VMIGRMVLSFSRFFLEELTLIGSTLTARTVKTVIRTAAGKRKHGEGKEGGRVVGAWGGFTCCSSAGGYQRFKCL